MNELTDDDRKVLTEYLGECWHEWEYYELSGDGSIIWMRCRNCKSTVNQAETYQNRTFSTPDDLYAAFSKMVEMVERGEWDIFVVEAIHIFKDNHGYTAWYTGYFDKWLFCLNCPDQIPERMKMAAGFLRERGTHERPGNYARRDM